MLVVAKSLLGDVVFGALTGNGHGITMHNWSCQDPSRKKLPSIVYWCGKPASETVISSLKFM
jgi:hypothetical protein